MKARRCDVVVLGPHTVVFRVSFSLVGLGGLYMGYQRWNLGQPHKRQETTPMLSLALH